MPLHDWSRVEPGLFHHFHSLWIAELMRNLAGILPGNYYALVEQITSGFGPDLLTLEAVESNDPRESTDGRVALLEVPPKVELEMTTEVSLLANRAKRLTIRHFSSHRLVAVIEIVSPGNKSGEYPLASFLRKTEEFIRSGIHLLVVDLYPPGPRDPHGIHSLIWDAFESQNYSLPSTRNRVLASYRASPPLKAFINDLAVGEIFPEMPVYLTSDGYLSLNLEKTYCEAFELVPRPFRKKLEGS
jgi:hypothetical protein